MSQTSKGIDMSGHKGQVNGYVRVSAADQNEARQRVSTGVPKAKVARDDLQVSRQTLYAGLSGSGQYAELVGGSA
ncbi:MAG: hypothetical protein Q4G30_06695 [Actinomycetaceae bacterium]|nr:hypothetical protein [Actinomycetaceae bacterium]